MNIKNVVLHVRSFKNVKMQLSYKDSIKLKANTVVAQVDCPYKSREKN